MWKLERIRASLRLDIFPNYQITLNYREVDSIIPRYLLNNNDEECSGFY